MIVAIRTDGSSKIGSGHIMRCLTLAEALRVAGASVTFICRGRSVDSLLMCGFKVVLLPLRDAPKSGSFYARSLGATSKQDAADTIKAIGPSPIDLLIVDHYGIGHGWHRHVRSHAKRIMVIDDLANRKYDCDLLLDQSFLGFDGRRYNERVPSKCKVLLGPRFALLRSEFIRARSAGCMWDEHVRKIFISFGGPDLANETRKALEAAIQVGVHTVAVIGESNRRYSSLSKHFGSLRNVTLLRNPLSMADAMLHTDLAIGAPGMTTWERACLGIPSVLLALAENQESVGWGMHKMNAASYLGYAKDVTVAQLTDVVKYLITHPDIRCDMARQAMKAVDGLGTTRVLQEIRGILP